MKTRSKSIWNLMLMISLVLVFGLLLVSCGGADTEEPVVEEPAAEEPAEERVFLDKDEVKTEEPESIIETPSDEVVIPTEKLSQFEIDELKADLIKKGVPIHEIDTIIEQARKLSRDLVEELIKSLGLKD